MPAPPALLGHNIYAASGSYLRDAFRRVHERLGGDDRLLQEANRSSAAYWEFQKLNAKLQPKDVQVNLDNSAEALLEALEAKKRGEIVQYVDETVQDVHFVELPNSSLWSPKVIASLRVDAEAA
ncbi:hypothetical protein GC167_06000 [bacterium]|nr:hypothetical protein [bacterium]